MPYSFATGGSGWTMVPCMTVLLAEIRDCVAQGQLDVTNLGQLGDARHQAEPTSRHNPARAPDGNWYVCAADFGGKDYAKLAYFHQALYKAHDPRVYPYGFSQRGDGYGLSWTDGNWKWTGRDQGHCHFDVTMHDASLDANWWTPALASTAPWGLADWLRGGNHNTADLSNEQIQSEEDDMTPEQANTLTAISGAIGKLETQVNELYTICRPILDELRDGTGNAGQGVAQAVWARQMQVGEGAAKIGAASAEQFLADTRATVEDIRNKV